MAISVVNTAAVTQGVTVASVTTTPTFTSTSGNLLIFGGVGDSASGEASSNPISDGGTNTWTPNKSSNYTPDPTWINIAYARNCVGKTGEAVTYTLAGSGYPTVVMIEVAGCDTTSPCDVTPAFNGGVINGTYVSSSLITPPAGDHLLLVYGTSATGGSPNQTLSNTGSATPTWTIIKNDSTAGMSALLGYAIVTANGTATYGVNYDNGVGGQTTFVVGITAFKISAGGGVSYPITVSMTQGQALAAALSVFDTATDVLAQRIWRGGR